MASAFGVVYYFLSFLCYCLFWSLIFRLIFYTSYAARRGRNDPVIVVVRQPHGYGSRQGVPGRVQLQQQAAYGPDIFYGNQG